MKQLMRGVMLSILILMSTWTSLAANDFPYQLAPATSTSGSNDKTLGVGAGLDTVKKGLDEGKLGGVIKEESATTLILAFVGYAFQFYVYIAVGLIMFFGWKLIISQGDAEARKKAISGIVNIAIGTLIIYLAYGIVSFVINLTSPTKAETPTTQSVPTGAVNKAPIVQ